MSTLTQVIGAFVFGFLIAGFGLLMIFAFPQVKKFFARLLGGKKRREQIEQIREWLAKNDQQHNIDEVKASLTLINVHKYDPDVVKEALIKYKKEKLKYGKQESRLQQISANAGSQEASSNGASAYGTGRAGEPNAFEQGANRGARDFDFARPGNSESTNIGEVGQSNSRNTSPKRYFE